MLGVGYWFMHQYQGLHKTGLHKMDLHSVTITSSVTQHILKYMDIHL